MCMFVLACVCKGVSVGERWTNPGVRLSKLTETIYSTAKWGVGASHTQSELEGKQTKKAETVWH